VLPVDAAPFAISISGGLVGVWFNFVQDLLPVEESEEAVPTAVPAAATME
jgi:hypothetical protein